VAQPLIKGKGTGVPRRPALCFIFVQLPVFSSNGNG